MLVWKVTPILILFSGNCFSAPRTIPPLPGPFFSPEGKDRVYNYCEKLLARDDTKRRSDPTRKNLIKSFGTESPFHVAATYWTIRQGNIIVDQTAQRLIHDQAVLAALFKLNFYLRTTFLKLVSSEQAFHQSSSIQSSELEKIHSLLESFFNLNEESLGQFLFPVGFTLTRAFQSIYLKFLNQEPAAYNVIQKQILEIAAHFNFGMYIDRERLVDWNETVDGASELPRFGKTRHIGKFSPVYRHTMLTELAVDPTSHFVKINRQRDDLRRGESDRMSFPRNYEIWFSERAKKRTPIRIGQDYINMLKDSVVLGSDKEPIQITIAELESFIRLLFEYPSNERLLVIDSFLDTAFITKVHGIEVVNFRVVPKSFVNSPATASPSASAVYRR